ncbi:Hypothetical_protein [Hexamita inflata]|uniref:Hypothetical_protein n=1 Tax=Hexamita inflata TaxID=28002 RepID=A0AA86UNC6_9EUKA|nr:Hypothetical protein HINF_LOCUS45751 [Hexamita inflata]
MNQQNSKDFVLKQASKVANQQDQIYLILILKTFFKPSTDPNARYSQRKLKACKKSRTLKLQSQNVLCVSAIVSMIQRRRSLQSTDDRYRVTKRFVNNFRMRHNLS